MSGIALQATPNGVIVDQFGNALAGRRVHVYQRDTTTHIDVFATSALTGSPLSQPLTAQSDGSLPGYVDAGTPWDYVDASTGSRRQGVTGVSGPAGADGAAGATGATGPPGSPAGTLHSPVTWASGTPYAANEVVFGSNSQWYTSLAGSNVGHDPTTDAGVHWAPQLPSSVVSVSSGVATAGQVPVFTGVGNQTTPGAGGGLSPGQLGYDAWWSQANPGAVTDWGAVIDTLVGAGHKNLYFGLHEFPCTTVPASLNASSQVTLQGAGGLVWRNDFLGSFAPSRLVYKGANVARFLDFRGTNGANVRDLGIYYDNTAASFTGDVLDIGPGARGTVVERCQIGSKDGTMRTAFSAVNLDGSAAQTLRDCAVGDAKYAIVGVRGNGFSNANTLDNLTFLNCTGAFIANIGNNWRIMNPIFEVSDCPACIDGDSTLGTATFTSDFVVTAGWSGDHAVGNTNALFKQRSFNSWVAAFKDDGYWFQIKGGLVGSLLGPGTITFEANFMDNSCAANSGHGDTLFDLGDTTAGAPAKGRFRLISNSVPENPNNPLVIHQAGHYNVEIGNHGRNAALITATRERDYYPNNATLADLPSISAIDASVSAVRIHGTDKDCWVEVVFSVAPPADTELFKVTFAHPYDKAPGYISGDGLATNQLLHVQLTAVAPKPWLGSPTALQLSGQSAAAGPSYVPTLNGSGQFDGFTICVHTPAALALLAVSYDCHITGG